MSRTITITVDEETDKKIREYASGKYGKRKGSLKRAYKDAINLLVSRSAQRKIAEEAIRLLESGVSTKNSWKFNRAELHER